MAARNVGVYLRKQLHWRYWLLRFHGDIGRPFHRAKRHCRLFLVWCCDGARARWNSRISPCTQLCVSDICTRAPTRAPTASVARATATCATGDAWEALYAGA